MEFTGERFLPNLAGDIRLEHFHRYLLCAEIVSGKVVLDIASGEGYGSSILSEYADRVIGVDISREAVEFAREKYIRPNLAYMEGDATKIPLEDASVDVVVSFETIEHHDKHEEMMREIKRVLRPSGIMILSSPNKKIYSDNAGGDHNHYHVKELYYQELRSLVGKYFKNASYYGQKTTLTSAMLGADFRAEGDTFNVLIDEDDSRSVVGFEKVLPMYFVVVAGDRENTNIFKPSIFLSLFDDYFHGLQKEVSRLNSEIKRMSQYIHEVHDVLKIRDADIAYYQEMEKKQKQSVWVRLLLSIRGKL